MKNTLYSSAQVIIIASGETYTLKEDEVYLNDQIYKKADLEIAMHGNDELAVDTDVMVGIDKRDGVKNFPADYTQYSNWTIDSVVQTTLSLCIENINTAIL